MKTSDLSKNFATFNNQKHIRNLYPTEFVIRIMLGTYPELNLDKNCYAGSHILDLGFGDGRNFPLLSDLDMNIHGVEISQTLLDDAATRFADMSLTLKTGSNATIPFADHFFDFVLSCHSCYYVEQEKTFADNLYEIARVLKPGGIFIFSLPKLSNFILKDAVQKTPGHFEIHNDPFKLRNGTILRAFGDKKEITDSFAPYFKDCSIGTCEDNYFGLPVNVWIGTATRI